jgi:SM-20-related protein
MTADANNRLADPANRPHAQADARCPHVVFRNVLGAATVAGLLDFVAARQADFIPRVLRNRETGQLRVDYDILDCVYLMDLGPFEASIKTFVRNIAAQALAQLHLNEPDVEPKEFEFSAYRDGGHFGAHIDTDERLGRVRVLSCVYYFAARPRRFSGGELRIYGFPTLSAGMAGGPPAFVDVVPETDTLVAFPSWLRHEVLPVQVPSGAWADGRFTINCWIHRVSPSAGDGLTV